MHPDCWLIPISADLLKLLVWKTPSRRKLIPPRFFVTGPWLEVVPTYGTLLPRQGIASPHNRWNCWFHSVHGSEIRRSPVEGKVVHPIIYKGFSYIPGGFLAGFLNHQEYCNYIELLCFKCKIELNTCTTNARKRSVLKNLCFWVSNHPVMCYIIHDSDSLIKLCFFFRPFCQFSPIESLLHQSQKSPLTSWGAKNLPTEKNKHLPSMPENGSSPAQVVWFFWIEFHPFEWVNIPLPPQIGGSLKPMVGLLL